MIELILINNGGIFFIGDDTYSEKYDLYFMKRPKF